MAAEGDPRGRSERDGSVAALADVDQGYIYHVAIDDGRLTHTEHGPGCLAVTGYSAEELRADPTLWIAMVPEADRDLVRAYAARLLRGEEAEPIVHRIVRKDGALRLVRNGAMLLHSPEGRLRGYLGRIVDVTGAQAAPDGQSSAEGFVDALQRMEQALVQSEQRARAFLESSPMGVHLYDLTADGRLVFVGANRAADRILGVDNRQFVGKTIEEAFPPLCDTEVPGRYRRAAEGGESWWTQVIQYQDQKNVSGAYEVYAFQTQPRSMAALFLDVSERLKMDEALRRSEALFRGIVRAAPVGFAITRQRVFQQVNQRLCEMLGRTADELIGQSTHILYPTDEEYERAGAAVREGIRAEGAGRVEARWQRKDGAVIDVLVSATDVELPGGVEGRLLVALDITDRKLDERLRQIQLDLLHTASGPQSIGETLAACLDGALQAGGMDAGGVYLRDPTSGGLNLVCHRGLNTEFAESVRRVARDDPRYALATGPEPFYGVHELPPLTVPAQANPEGFRAVAIYPIRHGQDAIGCITVAARSVDEIPPRSRMALEAIASIVGGTLARTTAEEALRVSEEQHRQFLENFQGIAYIVSLPDHEVVVMDGLVEEISGFSREDFLAGRARWVDLVLEEDRPGWFQDAERLGGPSGSPETVDHEYRIRDKAGRIHWVRDIGRSLRAADDSAWAIHGAVYDITERKRGEEERVQLEARLRQQQKLESIGTLAAGVAHEINNPLNGILNYAELLTNRLPAGDPLKRYADSIIRESERVSEIVRHLLAFSRQDRQEHSPARLCDIVAETMTLVRALFRRDQIEVTVRVAEDLPALKCRSQQIQQVLLNLLTNARDALNERFAGTDPQKRIEITAARFERSGRAWLRLTVADSGIGVPAEIRERIFDPFFTTKGRNVGTGLGLSVSYGIVKAHHGELTCESEAGVGTRFHLDLPVDNGWELGIPSRAS